MATTRSPDEPEPVGAGQTHADMIDRLDAHVRAVAAHLPDGQAELVAEMGGTGVLQIQLSTPADPDDPFDRAGIDPPEPDQPGTGWWVELAGGDDARLSRLGPGIHPSHIADWITVQLGEMRRDAWLRQESLDRPRTWFLTADELDATRAKMAQLNRRATRKGFTGNIEVQAVPACRSHVPGPGAPSVTVHGFDVTITGDPPRYHGWKFLAAADTVEPPTDRFDVVAMIRGVDGAGWPDQGQPLHPGERRVHTVTRTGADGVTDQLRDHNTGEEAERSRQRILQPDVVLRYLPGATQDLDHDAIRAGECDHCHTQRDRSSVLIVRHEETGETRQVGRSCVKDFLGWSTLPVLIDPDQAERAIQNGSSLTDANWDLTDVLTYSWAVIETHGWVSASTAGDRMATKDLVGEAIAGRGRDAEALRASISGKLDEGRRMAPVIVKELSRAFTDATSGYEANLAAILRSGQVHRRKHLGLAVSAVTAWNRQQEHQAAEQARAVARAQAADRAAQQRHVGTVGEPITMTGTVTMVRNIDGYRWNSPRQVLLVVDCGEAVAKMITTASWAYQIKPGQQLSVRGTVKAHDVFNGVPQTVLKRPKQVQTVAPDPLPAATPAPAWETVSPVPPQSRFQEAPLAAHPSLARPVGI